MSEKSAFQSGYLVRASRDRVLSASLCREQTAVCHHRTFCTPLMSTQWSIVLKATGTLRPLAQRCWLFVSCLPSSLRRTCQSLACRSGDEGRLAEAFFFGRKSANRYDICVLICLIAETAYFSRTETWWTQRPHITISSFLCSFLVKLCLYFWQ